MECPSCGSTNPAGKRFCGACGASLPVSCAACGAENPPGKRYCGDCGAALAEADSVSRPSALTPSRPSSEAVAQAERRQLTVMFCDLISSTALATRLDPEDLREVIGAYHRCVADTIGRYDGFVAKYMGDGVLIYFGYPEAHEDDAERAVRAGLAVIGAVGRLAVPEPLSVHLGIAGGLVVVGDLI